MTEQDIKIYKLLKEIGIPSHYAGYDYITEAIKISLGHNCKIESYTKPGGMYETLAKKFQTEPQRIERGIRYAIEMALTNIGSAHFYDVFGRSVSARTGRPTNSQFIRQTALELRFRDEEEKLKASGTNQKNPAEE